MMKKLLGALILLLSCTQVMADDGIKLDKMPDRIHDNATLQNGAKLFVNYCLNCHAATSLRYNKLQDIGLTPDQIKDNLLFTSDKIGDLMNVSMSAADGKKWFGAAAPDLSVMARAKSINAGPSGGDYIYTYLRSFYRDTTTQTGWDNLVFPSVGMPHVLWQEQGPRELTTKTIHRVDGADGQKVWEELTIEYGPQGYWTASAKQLDGYTGGATESFEFKALDPDRAKAYDDQAADIANFMTWMAEPIQLKRQQIGIWVLVFLAIFFVAAWRLNATYWKHIK